MGMFDTINANGTSYQTKAFGKNLREFTIGDEVKLMMAARTLEEYEEWGPGEFPADAPEEYQAKCLGAESHYLWVTVKQGIVVAVEERKENIPGFDYHGHALTEATKDH